jgi:hypothetical protein
MPKKKASSIPPKLTEAEQDLLAHIEQGYQLETDSLGGNPILRRLKNNEVIRTPVRESEHNQSAGGARPDSLRQRS